MVGVFIKPGNYPSSWRASMSQVACRIRLKIIMNVAKIGFIRPQILVFCAYVKKFESYFFNGILWNGSSKNTRLTCKISESPIEDFSSNQSVSKFTV